MMTVKAHKEIGLEILGNKYIYLFLSEILSKVTV